MNNVPFWPICISVVSLMTIVGFWWLYKLGREVTLERAKEAFRLQRDLLASRFLTAANHTGKPKGLRWKSCEITGDMRIERHQASGLLIGHVRMDISFEATPDGDMVEHPSAQLPRTVTGVFIFVKGHWETDGRAIFNLPDLK